LLQAPFFRQPPPKSAGADIFNAEWLTSILNQFERPVRAENVQATLCELTAITIAREIDSLTAYKIVICGGGSFNDYLIERLQYHLPYHTIEPSNQYVLHVSHVEAACFAWLAKQYLLDLPGNCPEVTGAIRPTVLGCCYKPT
jgi:anhydro-N-acetylmuramic acid kinase